MKTWTRAPHPILCGGCNALVSFNLPILAIQLANVKRVRYRCTACAGDPPPDLPFNEKAPALPQQRTKRMTPLDIMAAKFDRKLAQAGE